MYKLHKLVNKKSTNRVKSLGISRKITQNKKKIC